MTALEMKIRGTDPGDGRALTRRDATRMRETLRCKAAGRDGTGRGGWGRVTWGGMGQGGAGRVGAEQGGRGRAGQDGMGQGDSGWQIGWAGVGQDGAGWGGAGRDGTGRDRTGRDGPSPLLQAPSRRGLRGCCVWFESTLDEPCTSGTLQASGTKSGNTSFSTHYACPFKQIQVGKAQISGFQLNRPCC